MSPALLDLFSNRWLWTAIIASTSAQLLKVMLVLLTERRWMPGLFMETGGMPSSHSAMVMALTTGVAITEGLRSPLFAISAAFGSIVMYDATGVRQSSGRQALLLNDLVEELRAVVREGFAPQPLRVLLGHTYLEVLVGGLLGILIGWIGFKVL